MILGGESFEIDGIFPADDFGLGVDAGLRAFMAERALPSPVRGPVDF